MGIFHNRVNLMLAALIALCIIFPILLQTNTPFKAFIGSTFLTALVYVALRMSYLSAKGDNEQSGRTYDRSTAILLAVLLVVLAIAFYLSGHTLNSNPRMPRMR